MGCADTEGIEDHHAKWNQPDAGKIRALPDPQEPSPHRTEQLPQQPLEAEGRETVAPVCKASPRQEDDEFDYL